MNSTKGAGNKDLAVHCLNIHCKAAYLRGWWTQTGSFIPLTTSGSGREMSWFTFLFHIYHEQASVTCDGGVSFPSHPHSQARQQCDTCAIERSSPLTPPDSFLSIPKLSRPPEEVPPLTQAHGFLCWPSSACTLACPTPTPAVLWQTQVFSGPVARGTKASEKFQTAEYMNKILSKLCLVRFSSSIHFCSNCSEFTLKIRIAQVFFSGEFVQNVFLLSAYLINVYL